MVKKEALSSDLRFIKEVEELKIKQKLLIESLKRKNSDEQNKLFLEINSKLDFLVNIFQGIIDFFHFRSQQGQIPAGISGNLFAAMHTGVLFDVRGDLF